MLHRLHGFFIVLFFFLTTLFCWGMTRKWNIELVNQIQKADSCARNLILTLEGRDTDIHEFIGFPVRDKRFPGLNVRIMFSLFYFVFFASWIGVILSNFQIL